MFPFRRRLFFTLLLVTLVVCGDRDGTDHDPSRHCTPLIHTRIEVAVHATYDMCNESGYYACYQTALDLIEHFTQTFEPIFWGVTGNNVCLKGIGFILTRFVTYPFPDESPDHYNYASSIPTNMSFILNSFSRNVNSSDVGLSILLSARNIIDDNIGEAHVGIKGTKGLYIRTPVNGSFTNAAVITVKSGGKFLPLEHIKVIALHEISHLMGAVHDSEASYTDFIMSPKHDVLKSALPKTFSNDSINMIYNILYYAKPKFVKSAQLPICGNGVKESGEECDPGYNGGNECCIKECRLRPEAQCSWNQECCRKDCRFATTGDLCYYQPNLTTIGYCIGFSDTCEVFKRCSYIVFFKNSECKYDAKTIIYWIIQGFVMLAGLFVVIFGIGYLCSLTSSAENVANSDNKYKELPIEMQAMPLLQ